MLKRLTLAIVAGLNYMLPAFPAWAQTAPTTAAATAPTAPAMDAATLLKRVKQHYTELNPRALRLDQLVQTVTRSAGEENVSTSGTLVTYQQGPNERTVMVSSLLSRSPEIGAIAGYSGPAVSRLEWLRTPAGLQIQYQPPPTGPQDHPAITTIEFPADRLDPQMRAITADPLATLQTFDLVAASNPSIREEYFNGVEKYVVTSFQPITISPGVLLIDVQFWVGKNSLLVDRMLATFEVKTPEQTTPTFIDFLSDFTYSFDVAIPTGFFASLPPQQVQGAAVGGVSPPNAPQFTPMTPSRIVDGAPYLLRDRDSLLKNYKP